MNASYQNYLNEYHPHNIIEVELERYFDGKYRRIWIRSGHNAILIILFPNSYENYRIISQSNFGKITFESIKNFIEKKLIVK